ILEGLADLRDSVVNPRFREVIAGVIEDIEGGKNLSEALARFPSIFDKVFYSLISAGEQSGLLPDVLRNLTESLKWQDELAAHTKKIVMYPAFVGT
ncbi:MAG: type II secretion system F family protein, partial [Gammaproteobacteria bacterium]